MNPKLFNPYRSTLTVILILSLSMGCLLAGSTAQAAYQLVDKIVAIAEDEVVLASEIREKMNLIKENSARRGARLPGDAKLYEQILERLILDKLQLQRAYKMGLRVSDQELNGALQNIAAQNGLSLNDFRQALEAEGKPYVKMREQTRKDILMQRVQQRNVMRNISISPVEVDNFLSSDAGKKLLQVELSIDHLLLPVPAGISEAQKREAEQKILALRTQAQAVSQFVEIANQIERSGATHQPLGWRAKQDVPSIFADVIDQIGVGEVSEPVKSGSGYHLIRVNQTRGGVAEKSTETLVSHILLKETEIRDEDQSLALMDSILDELNDGRPFAELARQHSDDPGSALKGGELGWTLPGVMVAEFEEVMLRTPVGEVSDRFKSPFGWHILKVEDRRSKDLSEDNARHQARIAIAKTRYDDALNNWLQELRDNSFVEIK